MKAATACRRTGPPPAPLRPAEVLSAALAEGADGLSPHQRKMIHTLIRCRTPELGGHRYRCDHCGSEHFVPRSCGNRHCPDCQWGRSLDWLERQRDLLLPVPYFHVVFTLPHKLNGLVRQNRRAAYNLLFEAASATLLEFGRNNLGARLGVTAVLHTWSRTLVDHYHLHCIVTGGGPEIESGRRWNRADRNYLFPVRALGEVFRGKYIQGLRRLHAEQGMEFHGRQAALAEPSTFEALLDQACAKRWNVYAKRPFAGPERVLEYLSRYTHRVALGKERLVALDEQARRVVFSYKTRDEPPRRRTMELSLEEFLRRFALHILPERFVKIRHYGLYANRDRDRHIEQARALLGVGAAEHHDDLPEPEASSRPPTPESNSVQPRLKCPQCGRVALRRIGLELPPVRGSPP